LLERELACFSFTRSDLGAVMTEGGLRYLKRDNYNNFFSTTGLKLLLQFCEMAPQPIPAL
jgi:hypothetical protein